MVEQLQFSYVDADREPADESAADLTPPSNEVLAHSLTEAATLLQVQGANRFRVEAYFRAANMLLALVKPAWQIYQLEGTDGLRDLPGVTPSIARALQQMIRGGRWPLLERLSGNHSVEQAFASVPHIGPVFARLIHEELGIETLAELQTAAWDGRLEKLSGVGKKRLTSIRESLAGRGRFKTPDRESTDERDQTRQIPVAEILDVDDQYRFECAHQTLPLISPKKNNPNGRAWLPILHTERGALHYTAMFSNTANAHEMDTTHDWVVIYLEDHELTGRQGRWTVITARYGKLKGRRIVRGREYECEQYYRNRS